jgi:hypothetical protein
VPGNIGSSEAEFARERLLDRQTLVAQRGERAAGATKFEHLNARPDLLETIAMTLEGGEQPCHLEAERDRHRLLKVAAARHGQVAMIAR